MNLPSDCLHTFAAFAEDASLAKTAARLHLSQPAVHAQLRRLAEAAGVPLYRRSGRGLVLTHEGVRIAAFARESAEREAELLAELTGATRERRIVLAAGAGALVHVLGPGIRAFLRSWRGRLDVVTADAAAAIGAVTDGTAHVGVAALPSDPDGLVTRRLLEVPQVLALPRAHPLASKRSLRVADLSGERLVLPPRGRPQRAALDAAFASAGIAVEEAALATGWEVVIHLVALGVGLAVVNGSVAIPRGLVTRPIRDLPRVRYVAFTRPRPRPDVAALASALAETFST